MLEAGRTHVWIKLPV